MMKPISLKELKKIHEEFNTSGVKINSEELKDFTNIVITPDKILYTDKAGQRWIRRREGDVYGEPEEKHCCGGSGDCGSDCCEGSCKNIGPTIYPHDPYDSSER